MRQHASDHRPWLTIERLEATSARTNVNNSTSFAHCAAGTPSHCTAATRAGSRHPTSFSSDAKRGVSSTQFNGSCTAAGQSHQLLSLPCNSSTAPRYRTASAHGDRLHKHHDHGCIAVSVGNRYCRNSESCHPSPGRSPWLFSTRSSCVTARPKRPCSGYALTQTGQHVQRVEADLLRCKPATPTHEKPRVSGTDAAPLSPQAIVSRPSSARRNVGVVRSSGFLHHRSSGP